MSDETQVAIPTLELLTGEADAAVLADQREPEGALYDAWLDGAVPDLAAIRALAPVLRAAERLAERAQARVDRIKEMLRGIYQHSGEKVVAVPECDLELVTRNGYTKYTVNHGVVRGVVTELREYGEPHLIRLAEELERAIKESQVAGGVTVGRPKK